MKSYGNLYSQICSLENLYLAAKKARKLKSRKRYVEDFELHRERYIGQLQDELLSRTYRPSGYRQFRIYDPKERLISAAPFRDRVVHHALVNVIQPLFERRFIDDSYSCRKGKGTLAARERCRKYTNRFLFVLKCDVRKYFQSIDHELLFAKICRTIRCRPTRNLCRLIIDSSVDEELELTWFRDDDLFTPSGRNRGLPIGNLTSQLWANLYLDRMDHFIKEDLRLPGYVRYTDDFLLWSDDKALLHECRERIAEFLEKERLALHPRKTRVLPCKIGVPCLGFRFYPGYAPRLIAEGKRRFEKRTRRHVKLLKEQKLSHEKCAASIFGWTQHAGYGNVKGLLERYRALQFG